MRTWIRKLRRAFTRPMSPRPPAGRRATAYQVEELEPRALMNGSTLPLGFEPADIQKYYGFNTLSAIGLNGTGQTIAIVDAYNDPNIQNDLQQFSAQFGLPYSSSLLKIYNQAGGTNITAPNVPLTESQDWAGETTLDVEWAHALAPGANIDLVEANNDYGSSLDPTTQTLAPNLIVAADAARQLPGVSVVSMSWGSPEFSGETSFDNIFTTPANHQGVTFVASSGDTGAAGAPQYPSASPNVLAVGGTTLPVLRNAQGQPEVNSQGDLTLVSGSETGWSDSGGGSSAYEKEPAYQYNPFNLVGPFAIGNRTTPDVAFDADSSSGVAVFDSYTNTVGGGWDNGLSGGTSFAAPAWGALIAIADQALAQGGQRTLDGPSQTLPSLYRMAKTGAFNQITTGNSGYNMVGLGSPNATQMVAGLAGPECSVSGGQLTITGVPLGSGTATITLSESGASGAVTVNGTPYNFINSVVVNEGPGNYIVNVNGTSGGIPLSINLGSGTDTVNLSSVHQGSVTINLGSGFDTVSASSPSSIQGNVVVNRGTGYGTLSLPAGTTGSLLITQRASTGSGTWTLGGGGSITFSGIATLNDAGTPLSMHLAAPLAQAYAKLFNFPGQPTASIDFADVVKYSGWLNSATTPAQAAAVLSSVAQDVMQGTPYLTAVVTSYYLKYLHRNPDPTGLSGWVKVLQAGSTFEQVQQDFVLSGEFNATFSSNSSFVTALYNDVLNRNPDTNGFNFWVQYLNNGGTRSYVAASFLDCTEYYQDLVTGYYKTYLGRAADSTGLAFWVGQLQSGKTDQYVIANFIGSTEFYNDWQ